uniref:Uncharacterized protein n=1 Tax=Sphaerodactylus townsendi TaxID=933632 RepID=A0ACB8F4M8_9SAUR
MDVDLDAELMQKFSCLGTTDKDVLIGEFQRLLGFQLSPAGCAFFLDMTNCAALPKPLALRCELVDGPKRPFHSRISRADRTGPCTSVK